MFKKAFLRELILGTATIEIAQQSYPLTVKQLIIITAPAIAISGSP